LPPERHAEVERVWQLVREHIPAGYIEAIGPKFLTFMAVDDWYVALANQKQYISLYLMPIYVFPISRQNSTRAAKSSRAGRVASTSSARQSYR